MGWDPHKGSNASKSTHLSCVCQKYDGGHIVHHCADMNMM